MHFDFFVRDSHVEIGLDWKLAHFCNPLAGAKGLKSKDVYDYENNGAL